MRTKDFIYLFLSVFLISCQPAHRPAARAAPETIKLAPLHFATASDAILKSEIEMLNSNISWLTKNKGTVLLLEGHCDERGGDLYNLKLGDRRARRVKSYLIQKNVMDGQSIIVVSHGERKPVDPHHTPDAWQKNRRVEFIVR